MKRIRSRAGKRQQARIGAPDRSLTANAGLAAVTELCDRLRVIEALDAAVGPVKQRDRGFGAGELLTGIAAAQLAGEDFLTGLDRQRADAAGQQITPVPGLASTTAAGLARRLTPGQWRAVESGLAVVTGRMLSLLPAERVTALAGGPVTIDLDTTDVEVYGRKKRGVAYNQQGQRVGRPHVAAWAETEIVLAADLGDSTDDTRATAPDLLRRALDTLLAAARRVAMRADAGYFAWQLHAPHTTRTSLSRSAPSGSRRCGSCWPGSPTTPGTTRSIWTMRRSPSLSTARTGGHATPLLIRQVPWTQPGLRRPASRRRAPCTQTAALPIPELASAGIYAYSFIVTNLDVTTPTRRREHWYRTAPRGEHLPRQQARAALRTSPRYPQVTWRGCGVRCSPRP